MESFVREKTREEIIIELSEARAERDHSMSELADANAELGKIRYKMRNVNDVLFAVFGIRHAADRHPEDLKAECQRAVSEIKIERDKAVAQIEHDRAKIGELLNEIDCKRMELPPEEPIGAAAWLINAKRKRETNSLQRLFHGSEEFEDYDVYSVSDLREIAEHLLAYCKNNEPEACRDVRD